MQNEGISKIMYPILFFVPNGDYVMAAIVCVQTLDIFGTCAEIFMNSY